MHLSFPRISDDGLLMEDEMTLDGAIASACFDDALETVSYFFCGLVIDAI